MLQNSRGSAHPWVSVAQIENSLTGRPPMAVGFDIVDDTVICAPAPVTARKKAYSPDGDDYLKNPAFWEKNERRLG